MNRRLLTNEKYWEQYKAAYPFHRFVSDGRPHLSPEQATANGTIAFLRVPVSTGVHWGFESQADLDSFEKMHKLH